jgi:hypothetical protein
MCPSVPEPPSQDELIFKLTVEAIDFAWAPAAIDDRIAEKINHELAKRRALLSWRFGKTLSQVFKMPRFLPPLEAVALDVAWGQVRVTSEAMVIAVSFHSRVLRGEGGRLEVADSARAPDLPTHVGPPASRPRSFAITQLVTVAGGAALATLAAWVVVGAGARAWRYAAGRG